MTIPQVSHVRFLILYTLLDGECAGYQLRKKLIEEGLSSSRAGFYQMMLRLESAKLIEGCYEHKLTKGQKRLTHQYRISDAGIAVVNSIRSFYLRHISKG